MLDATPDCAVEWRAMTEASVGPDFAMPNEALFDDRCVVKMEQAEPWPT